MPWTKAGPGRPKGKRTAAALEKDAVLNAFKQRIMKSSDHLFNAAKSVSIGTQLLYKIVTTYEGKRKIRSKPILVTDPEEISDYIDRLDKRENGDVDVEDEGDYEEDPDVYYFITTQVPNHQAIKDLMDRAFGKPQEHVDHTTKGKPIPLIPATLLINKNVIPTNNSNPQDSEPKEKN